MITQACALMEHLYPFAPLERHKVLKYIEVNAKKQGSKFYVFRGATIGSPLYNGQIASICFEKAVSWARHGHSLDVRGNNLVHFSDKEQAHSGTKSAIHTTSFSGESELDSWNNCVSESTVANVLQQTYNLQLPQETSVVYIFEQPLEYVLSKSVHSEQLEYIKAHAQEGSWWHGEHSVCCEVDNHGYYCTPVEDVKTMLDCAKQQSQSGKVFQTDLLSKGLEGCLLKAPYLCGVLFLKNGLWKHCKIDWQMLIDFEQKNNICCQELCKSKKFVIS